MHRATFILLVAATVILSGCDAMMYKPFAPGNAFNRDGNLGRSSGDGPASTYKPIVDNAGIRDAGQYEADVTDCQRYAGHIDPVASAAGNAVAGAIVGALIGAAIGDRRSFARYGATVGAANGAVAGAVNAGQMQGQIVRNCMAGRGYVVLDGPTTVPINVTNEIASQPVLAPSDAAPAPSDEAAAPTPAGATLRAGSFANVPCDLVKEEAQAQCKKDHAPPQ